MSNSQPDWKIEDDYKYLNKLDAKGWAWEFLRRSTSYRKAYAPYQQLQAQEGETWRKKQAVVAYDPAKKNDELDSDWRERAIRLGRQPRQLTESKIIADQWFLYDMYDPRYAYDASIVFRLREPYPAFYGQPIEGIEYGAVHAKELLKLQPVENLLSETDDLPPEALFIVAFDARRTMDDQLDAVRPVFQAYTQQLETLRNPTVGSKYKSYIRLLDALDAGAESDQFISEIVLVVDPSKKMHEMDYEKRLQAASYAKKAALKLAEEGYKKLLFRYVAE